MTQAKKYYPFTFSGTLVFAATILLFGNGFADDNPYSFVLAVMVFAVLAVLATLSRLQALNARSAKLGWDSSAPIFARELNSDHFVSVPRYRTMPFFRLHFLIKGSLAAGRDAVITVRRDISTQLDPITRVDQYYPVAGTLHARAEFAVKDVFGMTRAPIGDPIEKVLAVRPGHITDRDPPLVEAQSGQENRSRMKSSDIERYFMREYIPGDRHRDINWKASSRFNELFTRISPMTQEKTQLVNILFRPYTNTATDTLRSVAYLDRCKSELLFFVRSIKTEHPEYEFRIAIGTSIVELEDEDDIDQFAVDLARVGYRAGETAVPTPTEDFDLSHSFVFTTSYDHTLHEVLGDAPDGITIYRVSVPEPSNNGTVQRFSLLAGTTPVTYVGPWALKTDRGMKNPPLPSGPTNRVESIPLEVSIV